MVTEEAQKELTKEAKKDGDIIDKMTPLKNKYKPNKSDDLED